MTFTYFRSHATNIRIFEKHSSLKSVISQKNCNLDWTAVGPNLHNSLNREALIALCASLQESRFSELLKFAVNFAEHITGPFEKFVDSPYLSESELCGGAVTASFSKYLPWQAMHFLQRSTHFSKTYCRPLIT